MAGMLDIDPKEWEQLRPHLEKMEHAQVAAPSEEERRQHVMMKLMQMMRARHGMLPMGAAPDMAHRRPFRYQPTLDLRYAPPGAYRPDFQRAPEGSESYDAADVRKPAPRKS